jgi:uroporphyrinogen-III synthase
LLGIHPAPDTTAVQQARQALATHAFRAAMFVSPNAVDAFFAGSRTNAAFAWPPNTLAAAPGPGTAAALQAQGVPPHLIVQPPSTAEQFDSESLWPELARHPWQNADVLVVRGEGGREWLIQRWQEAGAAVQAVAAYRRGAPQPSTEEQTLLREALEYPGHHTWLISSSEALDHLQPLAEALSPHTHFAHWAQQSPMLATHPRILQRAHALGFALAQACRPDINAVVDSYNRLHRDT